MIERYGFGGAHAQGPQAGDRLLAAGGALPFLRAAAVPAGQKLYFFSGHTPPVINAAARADSPLAFGNTQTQTIGVLEELQASFATLGLSFAQMVKLTVFMVADPALGRMDNEGFSSAYARYFGTQAQPHLPARTRAQVVGLVNPGWLVEIEAIAAAPD